MRSRTSGPGRVPSRGTSCRGSRSRRGAIVSPQPLPLPANRPPRLEVDDADLQPLDVLVPVASETVHLLLADGRRFVRVSGGEKK